MISFLLYFAPALFFIILKYVVSQVMNLSGLPLLLVDFFLFATILLIFLLHEGYHSICKIPSLFETMFSLFVGVFLGSVLAALSNDFSSSYSALDISSLVSVCLLAPITEELLYRGIILSEGISIFSRPFSLVMSALLFAAGHSGLFSFLTSLFSGVLLGILVLHSHSIYTAIIAHIFANILSFINLYAWLLIPVAILLIILMLKYLIHKH